MEFVRLFFIVIISLFVLYFLTGFADDLRFQVAGLYELIGQKESAVDAYLSIIHDFSPTIEESKAALMRLDPARFKTQFGKPDKKKVKVKTKKGSALDF
jgi:hypothetical protein